MIMIIIINIVKYHMVLFRERDPMNENQTLLVAGTVIVVAMLMGAGFWVMARNDDTDMDRLQVVATFYPLAYMAREIGGDKVQVRSLIPPGSESHTFSPKPSDILTADRAVVLLYNGAGMDPWFESDILPVIKTSGKIIVETTHGVNLREVEDHGLARLFIFDNDNTRTLVYDIDGDSAVLTTELPYGLSVTPHSGFFDNAPAVVTPDGYTHIHIPNNDNLTVLNTGLHGDHFHHPEEVITIEAGKPVHYALSPDGKYMAWALDNEQKVLVVETARPGVHQKFDDGGTGASSHATVMFDEEGHLYIAEMRTDKDENLRIVHASNGTLVQEGGAGEGPHGAVYSHRTKNVYINCRGSTFGITHFDSTGYRGVINYTHEGNHVGRSWISKNGTWLVSYVGNSAMGLEYANVMAYDLLTGSLTLEVPVHVPSRDEQTGWPNSIFLKNDSMVALANPRNGTVVLVDMASGNVREVQLEGSFPQPLRIIEEHDHSHTIWAVTGDGYVHIIDADHGDVDARVRLESGLGKNLVLSVVSMEAGEHGHHHNHEDDDHEDDDYEDDDHEDDDHEDDDHNHGLYDPHTWISPFMAKQQAEKIYDALVRADPGNLDHYRQRWEDLAKRFDDLDQGYMTRLTNTENDRIFVTHTAYGYLADRYGFHQHGVLGLSADESPSISAIKGIADLMMEHEVYVFFVDPVYSQDYANTIRNEVEKQTGETVTILNLYLMVGDMHGLDYFGQMEKNLDNLAIGLGAAQG